MRITKSVYLTKENAEWLEAKASNPEFSQSGIVNMLISRQRKAELHFEKANHELENARLADLEKVV